MKIKKKKLKKIIKNIEYSTNRIIEKIKEIDSTNAGNIRQGISGIKTSLSSLKRKINK